MATVVANEALRWSNPISVGDSIGFMRNTNISEKYRSYGEEAQPLLLRLA